MHVPWRHITSRPIALLLCSSITDGRVAQILVKEPLSNICHKLEKPSKSVVQMEKSIPWNYYNQFALQ